ncbi:MAG: glycosyltransferase [Planctomycetota bacterium]|nr:glycosyltransferase [Planctomycetota bacterium]
MSPGCQRDRPLRRMVRRGRRSLGDFLGLVWRKARRLVRQPEISITFLTYRLSKGYGVDVVVSEQLQYFLHRGYSIRVIVFEQDEYYEHLRRKDRRLHVVRLKSFKDALPLLKRWRSDVVIAHTPPFFSLLPQISWPGLRVFYDYGEPPAELFPDAAERQQTRAEKIRVARESDAVFSISAFIARDSGIPGTVVNWLGNDHLLKRRSDLREVAGRFRRKHGLEDMFLVLNVTRYFEAERRYKGVDFFAQVRDAFMQRYPEARDVRFVLIGRSTPEDRAWAASQGLVAFSDFSETELIEAYLDADAYVSGSQWEGYNLGIGQAISFGLFTAASDRGAHREFGIPVSNEPEALASQIHQAYCTVMAADGSGGDRWVNHRLESRVFPWKENLVALEKTVLEKLHHKVASGGRGPERLRSIEEKIGENARLQRVNQRDQTPEVSILILNRDKLELLAACVDSIERLCDVSCEILIADTGSQRDEMMRYYDNSPHQVVFTGFYNFSVCNNLLAERARGKYLLLLNNDTELVRADFRRVIDCFREGPEIGAVGGNLLYPDGTIQHTGIRIRPVPPARGVPEHVDKHRPFAEYAPANELRTFVSVTGACLMTPTSLYRDTVGGLDPAYQEEAQDVDYCLRLRARGLRSVVHPDLVAIHHENASRTVRESAHDRKLLISRYQQVFDRDIYPWQAEQGL